MRKRRVDLRRMFLNLQSRMVMQLTMNKENVLHYGIIGDATELCWLKMLDTYLPKRYQVAKALVLDSRGQTSDQIDIVIFDRQYSPFLLHHEGVTYVPAESVYAVIEVKQNLARTTLIEAGFKAASVRGLHRTSAPIPHAGGLYEPRDLFPILGGIVALDGPAEGGLGKLFPKWLAGLGKESRVDVGCVLKAGAFDVQYAAAAAGKKTEDERGAVSGEPVDSSTLRGTACAAAPARGAASQRVPCPSLGAGPVIKTSGQEEALIFFFLSLLERLQGLATVPAIKFGEYRKALGNEGAQR